MSVLENIVVIGIGDLDAVVIEKADDGIEAGPVPGSVDIERNRLARPCLKTKIVVVFALDNAVDQDWELDRLRVIAIVVGFLFKGLREGADSKPIQSGAVGRDHTEVVTARLGGRIDVNACFDAVMRGLEDFRLKLRGGETDLRSVLQVRATNRDFDAGALPASMREHPAYRGAN